MASAYDQAGRRDHAIGALPARELRAFLNAVDRNLGGAAEHGKHRAVLQKINGIVTTFAGGDLATIEAKNAVEFAPVESHSAYGDEGHTSGSLAPMRRARLSIAAAHSAPPFDRSIPQ